MAENNKFLKVAVKEKTKQEISLLAAFEQRHEYEIVRDALELYKAVLKKPSSHKKITEPISVVEIIAASL
jgi:hypothetical protein